MSYSLKYSKFTYFYDLTVFRFNFAQCRNLSTRLVACAVGDDDGDPPLRACSSGVAAGG